MVPASEIITRMKKVAGVVTDADLARELGLSQTAVTNWRHRGSVPLEHIASLAVSRNASSDWLVLGRGSIAELLLDGLHRLSLPPGTDIEMDPDASPLLDAFLLELALERAARDWVNTFGPESPSENRLSGNSVLWRPGCVNNQETAPCGPLPLVFSMVARASATQAT